MSKIYDVLYSNYMAAKNDEEKKRCLEKILYYLIVDSEEPISIAKKAEDTETEYYPGREYFTKKYCSANHATTSNFFSMKVTERPEGEKDPKECPTIISTYWKKYGHLIDACGDLRQTQGAKTGLKRNNPNVVKLAKKEDKDIERYQRQILDQISSVIALFKDFNLYSYDNYLPYIGRGNPEQALWLMAALIVNRDYREFCRRKMKSFQKKGKLLTLKEIEEEYFRLLEKRKVKK